MIRLAALCVAAFIGTLISVIQTYQRLEKDGKHTWTRPAKAIVLGQVVLLLITCGLAKWTSDSAVTEHHRAAQFETRLLSIQSRLQATATQVLTARSQLEDLRRTTTQTSRAITQQVQTEIGRTTNLLQSDIRSNQGRNQQNAAVVINQVAQRTSRLQQQIAAVIGAQTGAVDAQIAAVGSSVGSLSERTDGALATIRQSTETISTSLFSISHRITSIAESTRALPSLEASCLECRNCATAAQLTRQSDTIVAACRAAAAAPAPPQTLAVATDGGTL